MAVSSGAEVQPAMGLKYGNPCLVWRPAVRKPRAYGWADLSVQPNRGSIPAGPGSGECGLVRFAFQGANLPDLTDSVEFERGGFWRRALALAIDLAAICLVLELATLALFPLTNGRLQFSGGMFAEHCQELASVPEGLSVAAEFGANSITDCRNSLMGLPASRVLSVSRITRDGTVTK